MRVGMTYDLRSDWLAAGYGEEETAEFDRESTIEAIESALQQLGYETDRIGRAQQLVERLARGDRWDLVFNICEGLRGIAREAQVPAILDVYGIPYTFSDPHVMSVALDKGLAKRIVRDAGVPTPRFLVVSQLSDIERLEIPFPLFAKPLAEGTGKGVSPTSCVRNKAELRTTCADLLERFHQPVLVEEYLPGREFTVGLVGTGDDAAVIGTLEIVLLDGAEQGAYSYVNKERCEELVEYRHVRNDDELVRMSEELSLAAWRALNCRDGGRVDVRCDRDGRPSFIEVNPLAGLHPEHSDLPMIATAVGMPYVDLLGKIVDSALARCGARAEQAVGR